MSKLFPRVLGTHSSKSWSVTRVAQEKHSGDKPPLGLRKGPCFTQKMPEKSRKKQQIKSAPWATHDLPRARSVWEGEVQEVAQPRYVGGKLIHHPPPLHCFKIRDPAVTGEALDVQPAQEHREDSAVSAALSKPQNVWPGGSGELSCASSSRTAWIFFLLVMMRALTSAPAQPCTCQLD